MSDDRRFPLPNEFSAKVVVYLTPWCPYCTMAQRLLRSRNIAFETFDVSGNPSARAWLRTASGQHTVPQIFIGGRSIGGYSELAELDSRGGLSV